MNVKTVLALLATAMVFTVKVHAADLSSIHVKPAKAPTTYEICNSEGKSCHEGNTGEATIALLNKSGRVFIVKRTEQELQASAKGINLTAKK